MDDNAISQVAQMVREAEKHADDMSKDRIRAIEYYRGEMKDTPSDKGRSAMVTRDVRAQIKKVLPSVMRTLLGSSNLGEYLPSQEGDEQGAEQATDYVSEIVAQETNLRRQIEDALHDALLLRNGILTWYWEEKTTVRTSYHTGLSDGALTELVGADDVEVLEHTAYEEMIDTPEGPMPVAVHDVRIKRTSTEGNIRVDAVPREQFLIHADATSIADASVCGRVVKVTRSDLVAMGYDRESINGLQMSSEDDEDAERRDYVTDTDEAHRPNEPIDYYDVFVRFDADGDGIAELHHMCFAGGLGENNLLVDDECDEVQFCDIKVMAQAHQWEGISLADDLMDIQRAKTVLLRQTLDNLYWQNNPQPLMQKGAIANEDAVFNPEFGLPIKVNQGMDVRAALGFNSIPFVAEKSFGMLAYLDEEATERTGISDASSGLAPDALQNMTAKASAMIEQAGIGQTELMVRTAAEGMRALFRGILRLLVRHQDRPRTVRLRGEWVEFDPRHWNAEMDFEVNTGLGAGTRERDMQMMQIVMGLQEKLLAAFGAANNPYVKPENLWESISKMVEAAGLKSPRVYFSEPDEQEIAALLEAQQNQPNPEMQKAQAQMQVEQMKAQMKAKTDQASAQIDAQRAQEDARLDREKAESEMQLAREKMAAETQLAREKMQAEFELAREKMMMEMQLQRETASGPNLGGDIRFGGAVG